jgi:hypothetical protein
MELLPLVAGVVAHKVLLQLLAARAAAEQETLAQVRLVLAGRGLPEEPG